MALCSADPCLCPLTSSYYMNLCQRVHAGPSGCPDRASVCRKQPDGAVQVLGLVHTQTLNLTGIVYLLEPLPWGAEVNVFQGSAEPSQEAFSGRKRLHIFVNTSFLPIFRNHCYLCNSLGLLKSWILNWKYSVLQTGKERCSSVSFRSLYVLLQGYNGIWTSSTITPSIKAAAVHELS